VRRLTAWLTVVPLMLAGTEVAHALAYRLVYPDAAVRWRVLAATGHGYLGLAPLLLGVGGAVALAGLLGGIVDTARRRPPRAVPAWAFGLLPLAAFTLQEFLERWLALGGLPWWMVEQPTFRIGLLLQLPFACAAFLLARLLLRVVERVGVALRGARPLTLAAGQSSWSLAPVSLLRLSALALGHAERGPPASSIAPLS
jgi:hypothetical protein